MWCNDCKSQKLRQFKKVLCTQSFGWNSVVVPLCAANMLTTKMLRCWWCIPGYFADYLLALLTFIWLFTVKWHRERERVWHEQRSPAGLKLGTLLHQQVTCTMITTVTVFVYCVIPLMVIVCSSCEDWWDLLAHSHHLFVGKCHWNMTHCQFMREVKKVSWLVQEPVHVLRINVSMCCVWVLRALWFIEHHWKNVTSWC